VRRHFSVFVRPNALATARLGIIVSRKTARRAVDRNRIKRLVREAFRRDPERFGSSDLVVLARRCPARNGWRALRQELQSLLAQLTNRGSAR